MGFKKGHIAWNKGIHMWETKEHPRGMLVDEINDNLDKCVIDIINKLGEEKIKNACTINFVQGTR